MAKKVLIVFSHPKFETSRVHKQLIEVAQLLPEVTISDLYQQYPNFNINVQKEQDLLLENDIIILQHPVYWYSCPPILKQWIDLVLSYGWAYGVGGNKLEGKVLFNVVSSGGSRTAYSVDGSHKHTLSEFFLPFKQTAKLCKLTYLPPFAVQGSHRLNPDDIKEYGKHYQNLLHQIQNDLLTLPSSFSTEMLLNDFLK